MATRKNTAAKKTTAKSAAKTVAGASSKSTVKAAAKEASKSTAAKPTAKRKTTRKTKPEIIQETFIEVGSEKILTEELVERIKQAHKAAGHRIGAIHTLRTYVNLEERRAYYVINDKAENKYIEF